MTTQKRQRLVEDFIAYSSWASDMRRTAHIRRQYRSDADRIKKDNKLTQKEIADGYKQIKKDGKTPSNFWK